jgi:short-subunit dehydrogenase
MSKTLLTIGTNAQLGVATAIRFAEAGYRIVLVSGSPQQGEADVAQIARAVRGAEVLMATVDLADPVQVASLMLCFGHEIDVLQYHASDAVMDEQGSVPSRAVGTQSVDSIDEDICRHVTSVLAAVHAVLPMMRMRGSGSILLSTSSLAVVPDATRLTLSIGSAAVWTMVQALFEPLREKGVHIAAVSLPAGQGGDAWQVREIAEQFWQLHAEPLAIKD